MNILAELTHAVTRYDRRQSRGARYNPYALGQYLMRVDEIVADIEAGADMRQAICAAFSGSLLNSVLRSMKLAPATQDELRGTQHGWSYRPVTR